MAEDVLRAGMEFIKERMVGEMNRVGVDSSRQNLVVKAVDSAMGESVALMEEAIREREETSRKQIVQNLSQGSEVTKNMRPIIGFTGLILVVTALLIVPIISAVFGVKLAIILPGAFWASWTIYLCVYCIGRSMEKRGGITILSQLFSGAVLKRQPRP